MAPLYVYALTENRVETWKEAGRTFESVPVAGIFAVCERRAASPPLNEEELRRQHSTVLRIADAEPAVLPARFGSLVDEAELAAIVRQRAEAFRKALVLVRGNAQMTVRVAVKKSSPVKSAGRSPALQGCPPVGSGRAYLEQRVKKTSPALPPRVDAALEAVRRFVLDERRKLSDAGLVTVYQLVRREHVDRYKEGLERPRVHGMAVTGPWPPFAFVPDLWS